MTTNDGHLPSEHAGGGGSEGELNPCFLLLCLMTGRSKNVNFLQLLLTRDIGSTLSYWLTFHPDVLLHPIHMLHTAF